TVAFAITVINPPAPETEVQVPSGWAAITLLIGSDTARLLAGVSVTETTATTPLPMAVPFMPLTTHTTEPLRGLQLRDLPAAVKAGPAAVLIDKTSLVAKDSVHWRVDGAALDDVKARFRATEPPGTAETEPKAREF